MIFEDKKFSERCWTHIIDTLVELAGLKDVRDADAAADLSLEWNWEVVKDWSEAKRYVRIPQTKAKELYDAITDAAHGVLPWIKLRW